MEAKHVEAEEGCSYEDIIQWLPEEARPMGKRGKHSYTLKKDGCMGRIEVLSRPKFIRWSKHECYYCGKAVW